MKISSIVIAIILIGGVSMGMLTAYSDLTDRYDVLYTPQNTLLNSTNATDMAWLDETENMNLILSNMSEKVTGFGEHGLISAFYDSILLLGDIADLLFAAPNVLTSMANSMFEEELGIAMPSWVQPMFIGIIMAVIVFAVIAIFAKREV